MNIQTQVRQMDEMVKQGDIVNAVKTFFADHAETSDYQNSTTSDKSQMIEKMEGFVGSIAQVNGIQHHQSLVDGHLSASEFTFDFLMKDGSRIHWHEIIQREWNAEGKVVKEVYFNAA